LNKFAIVFSAENQLHPTSKETSSGYEKMAIALAYSLRDCMPDVDLYCGTFTSNTLSEFAKKHFARLKVNLIEDTVFPLINNNILVGKVDNVVNDYYVFNGFLRNFTKQYFAKMLLDQYDYLVYTDIDVLWFKQPQFNFDPAGPIALVEPTPNWCKQFLMKHVADKFGNNLYLNWIDIINKHNQHIFDIDYTTEDVQYDHASDVIISNRIDTSSLLKIEQDFGGYGVDKIPTPQSCLHHYDSLGAHGTLYLIKKSHPEAYKKYMLLFEKVLGIKEVNQIGYWETIRDQWA
jgi:hypothetical protein